MDGRLIYLDLAPCSPLDPRGGEQDSTWRVPRFDNESSFHENNGLFILGPVSNLDLYRNCRVGVESEMLEANFSDRCDTWLMHRKRASLESRLTAAKTWDHD